MSPSIELMNANNGHAHPGMGHHDDFPDSHLNNSNIHHDFSESNHDGEDPALDKCDPSAAPGGDQYVTKPGQHDVLLGRGGGTNNHSGNVRFRKLVNEHKMRYLACSKVDKPKVAREVVQLWRKMDPPGRFLARKDDSKRGPGSVKAADTVWFEVGDKKAREKASQCLRERTPDVLPYIKQLREQQDAITEQGVSMVQQQLQMQAAAQHDPYGHHHHHPHHHHHQQQQHHHQMQMQMHGMGAAGPHHNPNSAHAQHPGLHAHMQQQAHPLGNGGMHPSFANSNGGGSNGMQGPAFPRRSLPGDQSGNAPRGAMMSQRGMMNSSNSGGGRQRSMPNSFRGGGGEGGYYEDDLNNVTFPGQPQPQQQQSQQQGPNGDNLSEMEYQHNMMMMQQQLEIQQLQLERMRAQRAQRAANGGGGSATGGFDVGTADMAPSQPMRRERQDAQFFNDPPQQQQQQDPLMNMPMTQPERRLSTDNDNNSDNSAGRSGSAKRSRDTVPEPAVSSMPEQQQQQQQVGMESGELTLEEYRQQLEDYITHQEEHNNNGSSNNNSPHDNRGSGSGGIDDEDLEDDWEKEKEKNLADQQKQRGVERNMSGISLMSAKTTKSNVSMISGFSGLSDLINHDHQNGNGQDSKMELQRTLSSNLSLMSDMTDLSHNIDNLSIYDDDNAGGVEVH